jgi:hypothetical protein
VGTSDDTYEAAIIATTDGGLIWTSQTAPAGGANLRSISCATTEDCQAVGSDTNGNALVTTNGGTTWSFDNIATNAGYAVLAAVTCPSSEDCYAVGSNDFDGTLVWATTNGGATWVGHNAPGSVALQGFFSGSGIACTSISSCFVVAGLTITSGAIVATSDGGSSWTSQTIPSGTGELNGIACPSSSNCYAVGNGNSPPNGGALILAATEPLSPPVVTSNPVDQSVPAGSTATFSAAANGDPTPTVQWEVSTNGGASFASIPGATSTTLSLTAVGSDKGDLYRAEFSNGVGGPSTTNTATLTITGFFVSTASLPAGTRGIPYSYQLSATGGLAPYKWKKTAVLPKGLSLGGSGLLSGTVNPKKVAAGSYPISVQVTDSTKKVHQVATATLTLTLT